MSEEQDSGYIRLESQIKWYDKKSVCSQRWFKHLKLIEIIVAAGIPLVAPYFSLVAGTLGMVIVALEGVQHLGRFQNNWIVYRSTCEALQHEKYLYLAEAGPYEEMERERAKKLLARRVESLISTEHAKWLLVREPDKN